MRMSTRSRLGALGIVLLVAGAIGWVAWKTAGDHSASAAATGTPGPARQDTNQVATATRGPAEVRAQEPSALPPPGTTLVALWSSLQARAQAGDSAAACRLAIETLRCGFIEGTASVFDTPAEMPEGELAALFVVEAHPELLTRAGASDDSNPPAIDAFLARQKASLERCEGMQSSWSALAPELLRAAALAGQPDAQALYASGEGWFLMTPGAMTSPTYEQWVIETPLLLARMLDQGHPEAPGLLAGAYSGQTWLAGLYRYDAELAAAYLILNTRLMGKPAMAEGQLRGLDPSVRARARERAEALYQRHYAGRNTPRASSWLGAGARLVSGAVGAQAGQEAPCAPRAAPR